MANIGIAKGQIVVDKTTGCRGTVLEVVGDMVRVHSKENSMRTSGDGYPCPIEYTTSALDFTVEFSELTDYTPYPWHRKNIVCKTEFGNEAEHWVLGADGTELACCDNFHDADLIASSIDLLIAAKAALAALSQNATFPADITAAKKWLSDAIAKAETV